MFIIAQKMEKEKKNVKKWVKSLTSRNINANNT